ncbi:hypothetical protein WDZ92_53530, partial [Nostoc sp. NIES-2111]
AKLRRSREQKSVNVEKLLEAVGRELLAQGELDYRRLREDIDGLTRRIALLKDLSGKDKIKRGRRYAEQVCAATKLLKKWVNPNSDDEAISWMTAEIAQQIAKKLGPVQSLDSIMQAVQALGCAAHEAAQKWQGREPLFSSPSATKDIVGNYLPAVFKHHFGLAPSIHRRANQEPDGPYVPFPLAAFEDKGLPMTAWLFLTSCADGP